MLKQYKGKFLFKSESLLEEFTGLHLEKLLKVSPVKRQYCLDKNNRIDILGKNASGQAIIIELKKGSTKSIIDQLVRYNHAFTQLLESDLDLPGVCFDQKPILIAIASYFSDPTITYAKSRIPECLLLTYEIVKKNGDHFLMFRQVDGTIYSQTQLEIIEDPLFESLPSFIQGYLLKKSELRPRVTQIIQRILDFHSDLRFSEYVNYTGRLYKQMIFAKFNQKGKILSNKECASLTYYPNEDFPEGKLQLFVYLPTVQIKPKQGKRIKLVDSIDINSDDFITVKSLRDFNTILCHAGNFPLRYPLMTQDFKQTFDHFEDYYIHYRQYMKSRQKLTPVSRVDFASVDQVLRLTALPLTALAV